jgi:NAD(P)-dependent dehydrogenase (short-subunit alcohol dehydrogenase family)
VGTNELISIAGRTTLVTGGARGIGRMIARGFVEAGATVYLTSRSAEVAEEAAAGLASLPGAGKCLALTADLSTEDGCRALARAVRDREERLDVLVNNAGTIGALTVDGLSQDVWREAMAVNVEAAFFLVRELLPLLRAAGRDDGPARVINVGAAAGSVTSDTDVYAFCASKAGVHQLSAQLARRLAPEITVNVLAPGVCETRLTEPVLAAYGDLVARGVPLRRLVAPEDVVGAAIFLASKASAYLTGAVLPVDGGVSTT